MQEIWRDYAKCLGREDEYDTRRLPTHPALKARAAEALCAGCPALVGCLRAAHNQPPVGIVQAGLVWPERKDETTRQRRKVATTLGIPKTAPPRGQATDTHCARGHEWTDETRVLVVRREGQQPYARCRECQRHNNRQARAKKAGRELTAA